MPIAGGPVNYVTLWPTGQPYMPLVNTVVEPRGRIVATDAIVAAGTSGSIDMYASNATDLVIDVNGYFTDSSGLEFYPITPCRIVETRPAQPPASFGPPFLAAGETRSFPFPQGNCNIPASAQAYYVNFTVVPQGPLGYLTAWPSGQTQPYVSTLNSLDGRVLANGAIVPAGVNAGISVFVTNPTDLIIDVAGYFAPGNGSGRLFNTVFPCRSATLPMPSGGDQSAAVAGTCGVPGTATGVAMNMTATMNQPVGYFSVWPAGQAWPGVSVMNAGDAIPGSAVGNGPIVSTGSSGQVSVRATQTATVTLDVTGYFAAAATPPPGCLLVVEQPSGTPTVTRAGGNTVFGQGSLRLSAPAIGNWLVYLRARINFRPAGSSVWSEVNYNEASTSISNGAATGVTFTSGLPAQASLEPRGNGDYQVTIAAHGICGGLDVQLTPSNPAPSNILPISRPTITTTINNVPILGVWWFGAVGKDDVPNGYYSSATILGTPNWNGTLTYSITQGTDKMQLTCTNCNNTVAQAKAPSGGCGQDITITANAQGFSAAAPVRLMVNRPASRYPQATYKNFAAPGGYWSQDYFTFTDLCSLSMSSVAHHETFPGGIKSYWPGGAGSFWQTPPMAFGWTAYRDTQWTTWDDIVATCPDTNCNPQSVIPSGVTNLRAEIPALSQKRIVALQQMWLVGDSTAGSSNGFLANQCNQTLYLDHAEDINFW